MVGGDLKVRLTATDRLHGDPFLELGTVEAAFAHGWEPSSGVVHRSEVNVEGSPGKLDRLTSGWNYKSKQRSPQNT